jgi:superfamily I DNA and RNA helicase
MSNYCFLASDAQELLESAGIKEQIEQFAESKKKQTYVLCRPLSKDDSSYDYEEALAIFIAGMRPCFVNIGSNQSLFEEYMEDFIDDISFLSEKYKYREKIGRKKHWESLFQNFNQNNLDLDSLILEKPTDGRKVDLIISLVVGSINDVNKINLETTDLLDTIKSKIILFDTDQTSFVFRSGGNKKFVIQGLAGSGKTELLLHKMKEIYSNDNEARIAFTCFNKILASTMRARIPDFFDFMRVERQIDWGNKLFCFHSWGSGRDPISGMYRYICHSYGIAFGSLMSGSFDELCKRAIKDIKSISGDEKFIFDYVFIDESQDFASSFIELCELVTSKKVFVAGDVFQNIFRPIDNNVNRADMVLKKCYRTDPKNLMFSHALGMGLFEQPVLRWLRPAEWDACGYTYVESDNRAVLTRDLLRRFEDIPIDYKSTSVHILTDGVSITDHLISIIESLIETHPSLQPGDIAVIFLDKDSYIYDIITDLKIRINARFGWDVNVSFETKRREPDQFFISNINNAKGLEFPFVFCFCRDIVRQPSFRNALYTMMARSFLESHLILSPRANEAVVQSLNEGLEYLTTNNSLNVRVPPEDEIENQKEFIVLDAQVSMEEYVRQYCAERGATARHVAKLISRIKTMIKDSDYDEEYLDSLLEIEYERHRQL